MNVELKKFTDQDWMAFAGASGDPKIAHVKLDRFYSFTVLVGDGGLELQIYEGGDDLIGYWNVDCDQKIAEYLYESCADAKALSAMVRKLGTWTNLIQ